MKKSPPPPPHPSPSNYIYMYNMPINASYYCQQEYIWLMVKDLNHIQDNLQIL